MRRRHVTFSLLAVISLLAVAQSVSAQALDISYPTVRKRVDDLIDELEALRAEDERRIDDILRAVEAGEIPASKGTRMIKELNGSE